MPSLRDRIRARLRRGGTTDTALARDLTNGDLGKIYKARADDPWIGCNMAISAWTDGDGSLQPGGYMLHLAEPKELRERAARVAKFIADEKAKLALIRRSLRNPPKR